MSIQAVTVHRNFATDGGGLHFGAPGIVASLRDVLIYDNEASVEEPAVAGPPFVPAATAQGSGGAIYSRAGSLTMTESDILGNSAVVGWGGGIYSEGDPTQAMSEVLIAGSSLLSGNRATGGGSLWCEGSVGSPVRVVLQSSTVRASDALNQAPFFGAGGGIGASGCEEIRVELGATITENCAIVGGGVWAEESSVLVGNSTVSFNGHQQAGQRPCGQAGRPVVLEGGGLHVAAPTATGSAVSVSDNSVFDQNEATVRGGGIFFKNQGAELQVSSSAFTSNGAGLGGAIAVSGAEAALTDAEFFGNVATTSRGGAVDVTSAATPASVTIQSVDFDGNHAASVGGGLSLIDATASLDKPTFTQNTADSDGGGIHGTCSGALTPAAIGLGTFRDNVAGASFFSTSTTGDGGAIALDGCWSQIGESLVERNTAFGDGGGLWVRGVAGAFWDPAHATELDVDGCVIQDNSAGASGGGVWASEVVLSQTGGGGYQRNSATMAGGALLVAEPSEVTLSQVGMHANDAARAGGARIEATAATLVNVLVVENEQNLGAGLELTPGPSFFEANFELEHVTVAGNYGNGGATVNGLLVDEPAGAVVSGNLQYSLVAMNEGLQQMDEPSQFLSTDSLFYSHNPVDTTLANLLNEFTYAAGNGCVGANPLYEGGFTGLTFVSSSSNVDPWAGAYTYYSYFLLPGAPVPGIGAFGGGGGGWCAGAAANTCVQ